MTVYLVGAGPGDPELLTVRAVGLLHRADVVVHDRLVEQEVLELAPPWAKRVDVGKAPGHRGVAQEQIHEILLKANRHFQYVVRLKGGDPFVFGRGGEEAAALRTKGVDVEVVPGVTSALAAPAAAGIPVTMRGESSGFTVVTAHRDPATDTMLNWDCLARSGTTLVILMGAAQATRISDRLRSAGMAPSTPTAVATAATTSRQSVYRTTLEGLGSIEVTSPAVIVIGAVAAHDVTAGHNNDTPTPPNTNNDTPTPPNTNSDTPTPPNTNSDSLIGDSLILESSVLCGGLSLKGAPS